MNRAQIEELLVGVALPASKHQLVDYARAQPGGSRAAERLQRIPDREYTAIQDAGEELEPVQPERSPTPAIEHPKPESGRPPGSDAYTGGSATPANVEAIRSMQSG
jgi:hypothetical protein